MNRIYNILTSHLKLQEIMKQDFTTFNTLHLTLPKSYFIEFMLDLNTIQIGVIIVIPPLQEKNPALYHNN